MTYVRSVGEASIFNSWARPKFWVRRTALTCASAFGRIARIRGPRSSPAPGSACTHRPAATSATSEAATNGRSRSWSFWALGAMPLIAGPPPSVVCTEKGRQTLTSNRFADEVTDESLAQWPRLDGDGLLEHHERLVLL